MAPRREFGFFLLRLSCLPLAVFLLVNTTSGMNFEDMTKKLMTKCQNNGYQVPKMMLLSTVFSNSDLPTGQKNTNQSRTMLSVFMNVLSSATAALKNSSLLHTPVVMTDMMWNCTYLLKMITLMKNCSEASSCYMQAFVAPLSWTVLTTQGETNISSDDYDTLLWAVRPLLQDMHSSKISLPTKIEGPNLSKMMRMLHMMYDSMSEDQRSDLVKWAKEQITQNYFNCTMMPPSDASSKLMQRCPPSLKWLTLDAMNTMGPFLSHLTPGDVDRCPLDTLCAFFQSNSTFSRVAKMNPSLGNKFFLKIQECFNGTEKLADHLDKLGALACYYYNTTDISFEHRRKFLSLLDNCDPNPKITQVKKQLLDSMMSNSNITQSLHGLGSNIALLSANQLSTIPSSALEELLKNLGPDVQWKQSQLDVLVQKQLGDEKCNKVSSNELMALQSVAEGLPFCVLKEVKAQEILNDMEALTNITKGMSKGQLQAMLQGLQRDADPSELVQKLVGPLLHCISVTKLMNANITSLYQVENKNWSRSQAAYLAKKMQDLKQLQQYGRLHSVLQGMTCKMTENIPDSDNQNLAQAIKENPQWLSKVLAGCAAQKLFAALEKERVDYFKTITGDELDRIPTSLLIHLPPSKMNALPDSVCSVFLDKMETANLSSLALGSPSRPALVQRALLCLVSVNLGACTTLMGNVFQSVVVAQGKNLPNVATEDVSRLGTLLCEVSPSQLHLMTPVVLNSTLLSMASCQFIPQLHRAELINLVKQTFGDPSNWPPETIEALGPLLILDENAISSLPNKPWMKDTLYFLKSRLSYNSEALNKKFFELTTTTIKSNTARRKRGANISISSIEAPTVEMIENLGMDNVYWSPAQLNMISNYTFLICVETLGAIPGYNTEQLAVLSKKATEALGPVSQMNESAVIQLGCLTRGFSTSDLKKLPFQLDTLEKIAHCGWNQSQLEAVWKGVVKNNNLTAQQLGAADIVALNGFICGLNSSEIGSLNKEAFKDAIGSMGDIRCPFLVTQHLKNLAVSAFGDPSTWTEAHVCDLGQIIAGLNAKELAALDPSVLSFVSETCIPFIPAANFAELSVAQLEALGPDNAAMVTNEQKAALSNDQRAALQFSETGAKTRAQTSVQSGVPSVSVEGFSAFMKPFLFLLAGFLLL